MSDPSASTSDRRTVVVIGNGMVGLRFCEKLVEFDVDRRFRIVTFCEEPRAAYDRVGLTSFFAHRDAERLLLARKEWYESHGIELHLGDRAAFVDRAKRIVRSAKRVEVKYDVAVMATGSYPFVPTVPGINLKGVFVYRTLTDLQHIIDYAGKSKRCAVIGGGLLGLEAAKAAYDLGLETHVVEFASRLMPRQIDDAGSRVLVRKIEELGVQVHLNKSTKQVLGTTAVEGIEFTDGQTLPVDMIIVSAGIRPRDDLARECGLKVGERGGIVVDDALRTSDPHIFAAGECVVHGGMVYGLVAPGYEMAETVAANLVASLNGGDEEAERRFRGTDLSTKLKLMGVDVASFGDYEAGPDKAVPLTFEDPFAGVYKKLLFSRDGTRLTGGVLVGDASAYGMLQAFVKSDAPLPCPPHELIVGKAVAAGADGLPDAAQICSCNNVSKATVCAAIRDKGCDTVAAVKACTRAGTGCGGCLPMVTDLFQAEMKKAGRSVVNHVCEHFAFSRTELFALIRTKGHRTFDRVLAEHGRGNGCEVCKPAVASILASLWNDNVLDAEHLPLQDTNDRFLANIQRGGMYSVVPRVPGGEITPEKLAVIAAVGRDFGLYTKITGGQRIDLFGAQVHQLPDIWERLVDAGFESGHAYGKAVRTVKSCVGSTWCRYGVQDSVGFAIRIEHRYKGIRAPHKIKLAVSGCVRECAEAQCKDVGLVATENGYNLYVCGNGGAKPRHAELLAADIDEETAIRYIDRFLMYYITTADRLTRTSVWCEKLEGGIDHIRDVVVRDKLGLAADFEAMMQHLVDTYQCEWAAVVRDPEKRRWFRQFLNTDETGPDIEIITERGQTRPADWPGDLVTLEVKTPAPATSVGRVFDPSETSTSNIVRPADDERTGQRPVLLPHDERTGQRPVLRVEGATLRWVPFGHVDDFPKDGGAAVKYGGSQIAVFRFGARGEWYASQNMCPHRKAFVLSRGILGDVQGEPKVACPMHKKTFSLDTGESLQGEDYRIRTFRVKVENDLVHVELPPPEVLEAELHPASAGCRVATSCVSSCQTKTSAAAGDSTTNIASTTDSDDARPSGLDFDSAATPAADREPALV